MLCAVKCSFRERRGEYELTYACIKTWDLVGRAAILLLHGSTRRKPPSILGNRQEEISIRDNVEYVRDALYYM